MQKKVEAVTGFRGLVLRVPSGLAGAEKNTATKGFRVQGWACLRGCGVGALGFRV